MNTDISRRQFVGLAGSLATVLGLGLVGCGGGAGKGSAAGSAATKDVKGAAESKKLIVGFDKSYPPYGFVGDDGEYTGFDLDLANEVANAMAGTSLEAIDWDAKDALLNSGAINCIWNGFTMEGREDDYTFSEPYMLNEQVVVVKKNSGIKSLDDLAGKTVMTQIDSAAQDVLEGDQKALAATFAAARDHRRLQHRLHAARVRCRRCRRLRPVHRPVPDCRQARLYTQLPMSLSSEHYAVGLKKGDTELADAVTETLKAMYEDGTVKQLCEKYASTVCPSTTGF